MFRVTITDHRRRRCPLVHHELFTAYRADPERTARFLAASGRPQPPVTPGEIRRGIGYGLVALPLILAGALVPAWLSFGLRLPWWATVLCAIPMGVLPALVTILLVRAIAAERIARGFVEAEYCGSCGYDLKATDAEADGCRVCPECGAAWRVPDGGGPATAAGADSPA